MPTEKHQQKAREIRRHYLPWDEYPEYCTPGGISDQLEASIAAALESVERETAIRCTEIAIERRTGVWAAADIRAEFGIATPEVQA